MKMSLMLAAAAFTCAAFAQAPKAPAGRPFPPRMMDAGIGADPVVRMVKNPKIAEKIGLTKEQNDKIREIEKNSRESTKDMQVKMRAAMEKQASLLQAEKIDEAAVMAAIDELFEVRKEMAKAQTKRVIAVKAVLTPEQAKKALEEMKAMRTARRPARGAAAGKKPEAPAQAPVAKPAAKPAN